MIYFVLGSAITAALIGYIFKPTILKFKVGETVSTPYPKPVHVNFAPVIFGIFGTAVGYGMQKLIM